MGIALIILIIALILCLTEHANQDVFGEIKTNSMTLWIWLDDRVKVNSISQDMLYKFPDESPVWYVSKTVETDFLCGWRVSLRDGKGFRVLKGTDLHEKIEQTHKQALQNKTTTLTTA